MGEIIIELTEDEFDEQYPLVANHLNPNATWGIVDGKGCLFETYQARNWNSSIGKTSIASGRSSTAMTATCTSPAASISSIVSATCSAAIRSRITRLLRFIYPCKPTKTRRNNHDR